MPTSRSNTTRIWQSEWEERKDRLIELYLGRKLKLSGPNGIIETMANDGFTATKAQYEYQFRLWKVRKNMKRHEYERIIQERQHGGESTPITLEGRVISDARSERALRRYASGMPQARGSASLIIDGTARGNMASLIPSRGGHTPVQNMASVATIPVTESDNSRASDMVIPLDIGPVDLNRGRLLPEQDNEIIDMPSHHNHGTLDSYIMDFDEPMSLVDFNLQSPGSDGYSFSQQVASDWIPGQAMELDVAHRQVLSPGIESIQYFPSSPAIASSGLPITPNMHIRIFPTPHWKSPSTAITNMLVKGICDTAHITTSACDIVLNLRALANNFVDDVKSVGLRHPLAEFTPGFRSLFSTETFFGEDFTKLPNDVAIDVATEARLYSRLITSVINGFAGLNNIPAAGVLVFLNRHQTTSLSIIPFLCSDLSPVAKAFTENIFRAALEQDNVSIINFLLGHSKLVHANDSVCLYRGQRYTPIEIAAMNQSLGVIELLLEQNVDVNKSFSSRYDSNALNLLFSRKDTTSTIEDRFFRLADRLLLAGATISVDITEPQLLYSVDQRLTSWLIKNTASQALEKRDLNIDRCQEIGIYLCSHDYLTRPITKHQYEELVESLVRYASPPSEVTEAARTTRNQAMNLANDEGGRGANGIKAIAASLRSRDQDYLLALEENDELKHLESYELGEAFTAALEEGNLQVANRILDIDPSFNWANNQDFSLTDAVDQALIHNFVDIAWDLTTLMAGDGGLALLYVATKARKPDLVRGIIESGVRFAEQFGRDGSKVMKILKAAVEWGDPSIVRDLWQARSGPIYPSHNLMKLAVEMGQMSLIWDIFEAWDDQDSVAWDVESPDMLSVAIELHDLRLLDELIARGARLDNDGPLLAALMHHSSMIKPLLERYRQAYPQAPAGYCQRAIEKAIGERPQRPEVIDALFEFGLMTEDKFRSNNRRRTLLAQAIKLGPHDPGEKHPNKCLIERLLDAGSDVNATMDDDYVSTTTALLLAIEREYANTVRLLIQRGAEVNKPACFGMKRTPLQKAAEVNNLEIVTLLLENGAEVNALPAISNGATALQFAAINGNCQLAMTLIEHGARLDVPPPKGLRGRWPLEGAAENGRLDMIQLLWDANNGPFDDKQCQKAMRRAEYYGYLGCRDLIKELMAGSPIEY
ncbi:hypothetical protein F4801DRAFT_570355 [Xylaria longipes]|nr:hypothetical protein F4801DRAFT_570355 [Xylaria longipes]